MTKISSNFSITMIPRCDLTVSPRSALESYVNYQKASNTQNQAHSVMLEVTDLQPLMNALDYYSFEYCDVNNMSAISNIKTIIGTNRCLYKPLLPLIQSALYIAYNKYMINYIKSTDGFGITEQFRIKAVELQTLFYKIFNNNETIQ